MSKDGGPAFPQVTNVQFGFTGLSLRDYFAAAALTGIQQWDALVNQRHPVFAEPDAGEEMANIAYKIADAMLAERDKNS